MRNVYRQLGKAYLKYGHGSFEVRHPRCFN